MEIEEKRNANSWSELPQDLSNSIFERLGFADFQRAKSVCSSWHSASKQSVPKKNQIHWLILFPKDNNSCTLLFNPEEKDNKLYKTRDLGLEESVCIATYGSWLLMENPLGNLYIVNLFNQHERIMNLPPREKGTIRSIVFWIDEKTKDYVVIYGRFGRLVKLDVVYCSSKKKGDDNDDDDDDNLLWKQIPETSNCIHLVYKDHMLYLLSLPGIFKIFDFRENVPKEIFKGCAMVHRFVGGPVQLQPPSNRLCLAATQLVVNVTGEIVFKVEKYVRVRSQTWSFQVFKIYSSGILKKEEVDSLGDEAMLFDEGVTVVASEDNEGFIRNSIYFSDCCENKQNHNIFRFNLETKTMEPLHEFDSSSLQFSRPRWFLPSFTNT